MHNAPAVSYPVGRSHFEGLLIAVVGSAGLLVTMTWIWQVQQFGVGQVLGLTACLFSTSLTFWRWWHTPSGRLTWDGKAWTWTSDATSLAVSPVVIIDVQSVMLLFLKQHPGSDIWLWPERKKFPQRWLTLRRSLFNQEHLVVPPESLSDLSGPSPAKVCT